LWIENDLLAAMPVSTGCSVALSATASDVHYPRMWSELRGLGGQPSAVARLLMVRNSAWAPLK